MGMRGRDCRRVAARPQPRLRLDADRRSRLLAGMPPGTSAARRSRVILGEVLSASILAVLFSWIAGCITIDGTLRADGSGTMSLSYVAPPGSSETSQRDLLKATGITIKSLTLGDDRKVSATLDVDSLAPISKTALFRNVTL